MRICDIENSVNFYFDEKNRKKLSKMSLKEDIEFIKKNKDDPDSLSKVKKQTRELCELAVKYNGYAIRFVEPEFKTKSLCTKAIKKDVKAIEYVEKPTNKMIEIILEMNSDYAFKYIKENNIKMTENMYIAAIKNNVSIFERIKNKTEKICIFAVKKNPYLLRYIENQTEEICLAAVRSEHLVLRYVKNQTEKICLEAIKYSPYSVCDVREKPTVEMALIAIRSNSSVISKITNPNEEMIEIAVKDNYKNLRHIKNQPEKLCLEILKKNKDAIKYINNPNKEMIDIVMSGKTDEAIWIEYAAMEFLSLNLRLKNPKNSTYKSHTKTKGMNEFCVFGRDIRFGPDGLIRGNVKKLDCCKKIKDGKNNNLYKHVLTAKHIAFQHGVEHKEIIKKIKEIKSESGWTKMVATYNNFIAPTIIENEIDGIFYQGEK